MSKQVKRGLVFCLIFLLSLIPFVKGEAVENLATFSVQPILPSNNLGKEPTLFNLRVKKGTEQKVEIEISNTSNDTVELAIHAYSGSTNSNGVIDYIAKTKEKPYDSTLKTPLDTITTVQNKVTVPKKSKKKLPVTIKVPEESFQGIISGALELEQTNLKEDKNSSQSKLSMKNKIRYLVPILLTEQDTKVKPELKLNEVKATQIKGQNTITVNLQNIKPAFVKDLSIQAKVVRKGTDDLLCFLNAKGMQMAPNSNFNLPISLKNKRFRAGTHTLYLVATNEGKQKWSFERDFNITREEAKRMNDESLIELEKAKITWWMIMIALLLLILLLLILYLIYRHQKEKQKEREKHKKNKNKTKSKKKRKKK